MYAFFQLTLNFIYRQRMFQAICSKNKIIIIIKVLVEFRFILIKNSYFSVSSFLQSLFMVQCPIQPMRALFPFGRHRKHWLDVASQKALNFPSASGGTEQSASIRHSNRTIKLI